MPGLVLHVNAGCQCTHAAPATIIPAQPRVLVSGQPVATMASQIVVAGCPFQIPVGAGTKPSPCIRIEWSAGASKMKVDGVPVLVRSSIGKCYSPEGAMQGIANIVNTQVKISAL